MREVESKVAWLMVMKVTAMVLLGFQLYQLTIPQSAVWQTQADQNRLREVPRYGPRGVIYDRKGRSLATSEPAFAAVLVNQDPEMVERILPQLSLLLAKGEQAKADQIATRVRLQVKENGEAGRQFEQLVVERRLDQSLYTTFMERQMEFPGVRVIEESHRNYPYGPVAGSLVGYVGQINLEELQSPAYKQYYSDETVGKAGLEGFYESKLRGQPGANAVVVDPLGRPVGTSVERAPRAGNSLVLSMDLELQKFAEEALYKQMEWIRTQNSAATPVNPIRGSLVVQEVKTGAILAMASFPNYDPNRMVKGLTDKDWLEINNTPGYFYNWAIQGFPPGSIYKIITAYAGLASGTVGPYDQIDCPPRYWRYDRPRNWNANGQGPADVARALAVSCNPYFFELGHLMGIKPMAQFAGQFGIGKETGIDLPGESPGVNPTQETYAEDWYPGNVIQVAIGQGRVLVTPLQMANYTAAVALKGTRYRPYLVDQIKSSLGETVMKREPMVSEQIQLPPTADPRTWERLQEGMRLSAASPEGTAYLPFLGFPIKVAAKTGSAETGSGIANGTSVAYAPLDDPQIAVSVVIEGGSVGSWTTPIIRRVMAKYFGINDVIPAGVPVYRD